MLLICTDFNANLKSAFYLYADPNPTFFFKNLNCNPNPEPRILQQRGKNNAIFSVLPTGEKKAAMPSVPFLCNYMLN